jgi:DNA polymerase-1
LLRNGYAENLFGRRYYNTSGHKARNYLIQGSCADYLKIKLKEIDDYLVAGNYKSRMQMNIHDECSFEIYKGEEHIIKDLQAIMQQLDGSLIPILADLEITYTTWDEKVDLEL